VGQLDRPIAEHATFCQRLQLVPVFVIVIVFVVVVVVVVVRPFHSGSHASIHPSIHPSINVFDLAGNSAWHASKLNFPCFAFVLTCFYFVFFLTLSMFFFFLFDFGCCSNYLFKLKIFFAAYWQWLDTNVAGVSSPPTLSSIYIPSMYVSMHIYILIQMSVCTNIHIND